MLKMASVAELFLQLSSNEQLHQKLLSSKCFEEKNFDEISVLLKTLYVFVKSLQHEYEGAKSSLCSIMKRLSSLGSALCQECSEKSLLIFHNEMEKENLPKTDAQAFLPSLLSSDQKYDTECSCPHSESVSSPRKKGYHSGSRQKRHQKDKMKFVLNPNLEKLHQKDIMCDTDLICTTEILAQETQEVNKIPEVRVPIDGRSCIPETIPMDVCENVGPSTADESCDIFDDSSEGTCDASDMYTMLHTSPVLGKTTSNRSSPLLVHSSTSSGSSRPTSKKKSGKIYQKTSLLCNQNANDEEEMKNEPVEFLKKSTLCKNFSPAMSPKCGSEIENSPSLLQLKPLKSNGVSNVTSHSNKPVSLVDICSSSESPQLCQSSEREFSNYLNSAAKNSSDRCSAVTKNTKLASNLHPSGNILAENTKNLNCSDLSSFKNSKASPDESRVKCNLSDRYFNINTEVQSSPTKITISSCSDVHSSVFSGAEKALAVHNNDEVTCNANESRAEGSSVVEKASGLVSTRSQNPSKISPENSVPGGSRLENNQLNLTIQDRGLSSRMSTSRLSLSKRSATDIGSTSAAFRGSSIKWDLTPKSVQATVKRNFKQTKLSKESFIVSKVKGNLEEDDPVLAEAKARSLATKAIDDRKRLQLTHPALRQLPSSLSCVEQEKSPSPDKHLPSKRRLRGSVSDQSERKKCKTEFEPAIGDTNRPHLSADVTGGTLVTESQVLKYLQDSPSGFHQIDNPAKGEIVKSPTKHSPSPKKGASKNSKSSKSTTPKKPTFDESSTSKYSFLRRPSTSCSPSKKLRSPRKKIASNFSPKKLKGSPKKCEPFEPSVSPETKKAKITNQGTKHNKIMDDSFDRVPCLHNSPSFAHAGPVERKKSRRLQLPGWSCRMCEQYYEGRQLSREELLEYMNRCSKHRSKHKPITNTPENFWKPDMSGSEDDEE